MRTFLGLKPGVKLLSFTSSLGKSPGQMFKVNKCHKEVHQGELFFLKINQKNLSRNQWGKTFDQIWFTVKPVAGGRVILHLPNRGWTKVKKEQAKCFTSKKSIWINRKQLLKCGNKMFVNRRGGYHLVPDRFIQIDLYLHL